MITNLNTSIKFFPNINSGVPSRSKESIKNLITGAFLLSTEGRALFEDFEGVEISQPETMYVLKIKLIEFLFEMEMILNDSEVDQMHYFPLCLEYGMPDVLKTEPERITKIFGLDCADQTDIEQIAYLWNRIISDFPGNIPNPLQNDQQGEFLQCLRNWSKLCKRNQIDDSFLIPLFKAL